MAQRRSATKHSAREANPDSRVRIVEVMSASTIAFALPLLWTIFSNPTFAVAHDLVGLRLVAFAIGAVAVPGLAFSAISMAFSRAPASVGTWTHRLLMGALLSAIAAPVMNQWFRGRPVLAASASILLLPLAVHAYTRLPGLRKLVQYAVFSCVAVPILFLLSGPIRPLLSGVANVSVVASTSPQAPILWIVFDQLPLALLLDGNGDLLEQRYPGFAHLRDVSTWYPNAVSVTPDTHTSVTSALTGRLPEPDAPPFAAHYPNNAFTLLGNSYDVSAYERVTRLCPPYVCEGSLPQFDPVTLVLDSSVVVGRLVVPDLLADQFLPEMDTRWTNFRSKRSSNEQTIAYGDDREEFRQFLDELENLDRSKFYYFHQEKPHEPLLMLPDGRIYDYCSCFHTDEEGRWPDDPAMLGQRLQQYVMQTMHVDRELHLVLRRLEELGTLKETLIVVMSDHGAAMLPGHMNRGADPTTASEVFPVPLFIKYPGQTAAEVDPRPARLIDLLPTLLDALDVTPQSGAFEMNGTSLKGTSGDFGRLTVVDAGELTEIDYPSVTDSALISLHEDLLPDEDNPFVFGPYGHLVGQNTHQLVSGESDLTASLATLRRFDDVTLSEDYVPAHVIGEIFTKRHVDLAVAFNGRIAGVGTTYFSKVWRISLMADPEFLTEGSNEVSLFEIDGGRLYEIRLES